MKKQQVAIQKPNIGAAALNFAKEAPKSSPEAVLSVAKGSDTPQRKKMPVKPSSKANSGLVPEGDIRLTANISKEHHKALKIAAIERGLTVGELIEQMVENLK